MPLNNVTIHLDLNQLLGGDIDTRRTRVYVKTNVPNATLIDTSTGETRLGDEKVTLETDGTGSFTTWGVGADGNPTSWQTSVIVEYPRAGSRDRVTRTFGPYTITDADDGKNLAALEDQQAIPPNYQTAFTADMEAIRDEAEAARDAAVDISGISTSDDVVSTLIEGTGGAGPLTRSALSTSTEAQIEDTFSGYVPPGVYVRTYGDTTLPVGIPDDVLIFTEEALVLKKWDGIGIPTGTAMTTTTTGESDSAFGFIAGSPTFTDGSIRFPSTGTNATVKWDALNRATFGLRFYLRVEAWPASGNAFPLRADRASGAQMFAMTFNTSGQPQLRNPANSAVWTGTALTVNKTYRVEIRSTVLGTVRIRVYNLAGSLVTSSGDQALGYTDNIDALTFGRNSSVEFGPGHYKNLKLIADAFDVGAYPGVAL